MNKFYSRWRLADCIVALLLLPAIGHAAPVEKTTFQNRAAYRITDGVTQAVVVPEYSGRVMFYGKVGGANWLWNAPPDKLVREDYRNYGGDKTFVGPHSVWKLFAKSLWPPQPSWDGLPHRAEVLPGGVLRTVSPVWKGFGTRAIREYSLNSAGEFAIKQTMEKVEGGPVMLSIWSVSQAVPPDAVYLTTNPQSPYRNGYHWFGRPKENAAIEALSSKLLQIKPQEGLYYKIGADSPVSAIAAVKSNQVWVQRSNRPQGQYPDGAESAGFPVELYNHGENGNAQYVEIELLSPLRVFHKGTRWTHTVRWSLHALQEQNERRAEFHKAIEHLLAEDGA